MFFSFRGGPASRLAQPAPAGLVYSRISQLSSVYSICGGSSAAIIGSAIYTSPDPLQVVLEIKRLRDEVINKL